MEKQAIASAIEQSVLKPTATAADVIRACREAAAYGFHGICVNPVHTSKAREAADSISGGAAGKKIKIVTVIAFPLGSALPSAKVYEAMKSAQEGSDELDIVMSIPLAMEGDWRGVEKDISDVIAATPGLVHKVIIETAYLKNSGEMEQAALAALRAGASFIKTSTGYSPKGATVADVLAIKKIIGDRAGIKAAGGIRSWEEAIELLRAGAARLGTSAGVRIVGDLPDSSAAGSF